MPRSKPYQSNFTAGELSPRLFGWVDLERYVKGAAAIENMIVLPHGGVTRRSGSVFVDEPSTPGFMKLVGFPLELVQSYALAFVAMSISLYANRGVVVDGRDFANGTFDSGIAGWADNSPGTGSITHDAANGRMNLVGGGATNEARAEQSFRAVSIESYTVTLDVFDGEVTYKVGTSSGGTQIATGSVAAGLAQSFAFQASASAEVFITFENANNDTRQVDNVSLSSPIYRLDSPYEESDLDLIQTVKEGATLTVTHPDFNQRTLTRRGVNEWTLEVLDFEDGPYLDANETTTTLNPGAATGTGVALAASSVDGINDGRGFLATDVGRLVRLNNATAPTVNWGWAIITAVTDTLNVTIDIQRDFATANASTQWRLGVWCDTTGYPRAVAFFDQRFVFANSAAQPNVFWMSRPERTADFAPTEPDGTVNDDNAITYRILDADFIDWMAAADTLVVGTGNGEFIINSGSRTVPVTPTNIIVKRQTNWGSDGLIRPTLIGGELIFVQRAGRKLRNFVFDFDVNRYVAPDITIVAEHITRGQVFDLAYQQEPDSVLWVPRGDGVMAALTYEREQDTLAWHRHLMGGSFQGGNAVVESVAVIPTPDSGSDELWLTVVRTINGQTRRYVEVLSQPFSTDNGDLKEDAFFVDSGLTYDGPPASAFGGLDHLEGQTVAILADGAVRPNVVIQGGQAAIGRPASKVHIGLPYLSLVKGLRIPADGFGDLGRIDHLHLLFHDTLGARYGRSLTRLDTVTFREGSDKMDSSPDLFTGWKRVAFDGNHTRDREWFVLQAQPLPMTLLGVQAPTDTGDG